MRAHTLLRPQMQGRATLAVALFSVLLVSAGASQAGRARTHEKVGNQLFESPQVNPIVLNAAGTRLCSIASRAASKRVTSRRSWMRRFIRVTAA